MSYSISQIPEGYSLYEYDDCGNLERQPHINMQDSYVWTFNTSDTDADLKSRSAVFSYKEVRALYENLDEMRSYVLAVTYANDHVYHRVQSLSANGVEIHGPYEIPKAKAVRLIFQLTPDIIKEGKMNLEFKLHDEVNVTVSLIELWATGEPKKRYIFDELSGCYSNLSGRILDLSYELVPDAQVMLYGQNGALLATTKTNSDGLFEFERHLFEKPGDKSDVKIVAIIKDTQIEKIIPRAELYFEPVRYIPKPKQVVGLKDHEISLDGEWFICPTEASALRTQPLHSDIWKKFTVPGQWLQQGFDVKETQTIFMTREFQIPKEWSRYNAILRFDSIHAGTHYFINGHELGYSENLFTPVEWDITKYLHYDQTNRIDLEMRSDTVSEKLSHSSGYAFHNLGGIDRSVGLFALPAAYISELHLGSELDENYKNGILTIDMKLKPSSQDSPQDFKINVTLISPDKNKTYLENPEPAFSADFSLNWSSPVKAPQKWSAEQPHLYQLKIELKRSDQILETIEKQIGFRTIEVKGSQVYLNGARIKLAGACHHEIDPLTGRADTMKYAEKDVMLLKQANLNYIRTSHYPPCEELVDAADRIGMYLEVEAPFCWVQASYDVSSIKQVLIPTSAMIDFYHTHPSVIIWSIANESAFNRLFEISGALCKNLDPTRLTTFNFPDPKRICDIGNWHYPPMPYDENDKEDKRPILLGEFFFPICHEQKDVMINPGLRELYGHGHSDPDSAYAKYCASSFDQKFLQPGAKPGFWEHILQSERIVGGAIWAALDEPYYFSWRAPCGYAWVHGFWGLIDGWRRLKPEFWMAKMIFSPVWFPVRNFSFQKGDKTLYVPVENRYDFTDLNQVKFEYELSGKNDMITMNLPPQCKGILEIPIPQSAEEGDPLIISVKDNKGNLINILQATLGKPKPKNLPAPKAGSPKITNEESRKIIEGNGFSLVFDAAKGDFDSSDSRHTIACLQFPSVHITRFDFGDLAGPNSLPYAVFPERSSRVVANVDVRETSSGLELIVAENYENFSGTIKWALDNEGIGYIDYNYVYSGEDIDCREIGIRMPIRPDCDTVKWRRWFEWGYAPEEFISRPEGEAKAHRPEIYGRHPEGTRPTWEWRWDETELGTNDFRGVKLNIYEASLVSPEGAGLCVHADADAHLRPSLDQNRVMVHILSHCKLGPTRIKKGEHIKGRFVLQLLN